MKRSTGRALRAPLAGSPVFFSVFDFVFDSSYVWDVRMGLDAETKTKAKTKTKTKTQTKTKTI